jgi:hypothetical protein
MPQCGMRLVRPGKTKIVFTQHPDNIHPRDLSSELLNKYGEQSVKISLRRNIYVIYIDRDAVRDDDYVS